MIFMVYGILHIREKRKIRGRIKKSGFRGQNGSKLVEPDLKSVFINEKNYPDLETIKFDFFLLFSGLY